MSISTTENIAAPGGAIAKQAILATRIERLIATIIDGLILILIAMPVMFVINFTGIGGSMFLSQIAGLLAGLGVFLALNYNLLRTNGQTIGKRVMNIRIVDRNDQPVEVNELLLKRYAPVWAASLVPVVGPLACLANALCIFRESQACIHDDIAQTRVVVG